jgi:menaquinol-cytochrome c reductase iron-sulfur subunit
VANADQATTSRRTFLVQAISACLAFLAALLGIPAVGAAVGPALRRTEPTWIPLGRADVFPVDTPTPAEFNVTRRDGWIESTETRAVWVIRQAQAQDQYAVFNGRCTHLGCAYHWQADRNQFACPCHAGVFGKDGQVLAGPPPRGLDPLPARVDGGTLQVQYLDFRLGVAERVQA